MGGTVVVAIFHFVPADTRARLLAALGPWWVNDAWPWITAFVTSPGFGGVAVFSAALIALFGVHRTARLNAWWQRADWALQLVSRENATDQDVELGLTAIAQLVRSKLATPEEAGFLSSIAEVVALDDNGDGINTDDRPAGTLTKKPGRRALTSGILALRRILQRQKEERS